MKLLKEELVKLARDFVCIPSHFELVIENYSEEEAYFLWADAERDLGVTVTLNKEGKLTYLSKELMAVPSTAMVSFEQRKEIAEDFLRQQYADALVYLSFSYAEEKERSTKFVYEQFVGNLPLSSYYCYIEVSCSGEIVLFNYKGYTENLPVYPKKLIDKEKILTKCLAASNWQLRLDYLSHEICDVENDGLYMLYENREFMKKFDANTGDADCKDEVEEELEIYEPFPKIEVSLKSEKIEDIIGIPSSMELLRQVDQGDEIGLVWREKDWQSSNDRSFEGFFSERAEDTVKATISKTTNQLKSFIWMKERIGTLELSFEQCKEVAIDFVGQHFSAFIPYMQILSEQESFNEDNKAFFTFPLHAGNGLRIEGEFFRVAVNRTTGLIDLLMSPSVSINMVEQMQEKPIIPLNQLVETMEQIDACVQWSREYRNRNQSYEQLKYKLCERSTKRSIKGINAWTGALICRSM